MKIVLNTEDIIDIIKGHLKETYNFEVTLEDFGYNEYNELVAEATLKGMAKKEKKVKESFIKQPTAKSNVLINNYCSVCKNSGNYSYGGNGPNCPECGGS